MTYWATTTDTLVKVGSTWILRSAMQAVEPSPAGKARVHLAGGGTIDIDKPTGKTPTEWTDTVARAIFSTTTKDTE